MVQMLERYTITLDEVMSPSFAHVSRYFPVLQVFAVTNIFPSKNQKQTKMIVQNSYLPCSWVMME